MGKALKRRILRIVCICTAFFALGAFSGCADLLTNWNEFFSSDDSQTESSFETSSEDSSHEDIEESERESSEESSEENSEESSEESSEEDQVSEDESSSDDENSSDDEESDSSGGVFETTSEEESVEEEQSSDTESVEDSSEQAMDSSTDEGEDEPAGLDFSPVPLSEKYGYQQFAKEPNGEQMQNFYEDIYEVYLTFYNSTRNVASQEVLLNVRDPETNEITTETREVYQIGEADFGQYGLSKEEATTVWSIAMLDLPEFYWQAHSSSTTSTKKINLYIDGEYANYSERQEVETALYAMAEECFSYLREDMCETERALAIQDYIIGNISYAYELDGVTPQDAYWAHNVEGLIRQSGVCESYAKVYDYFCELMGLDCITVTGLGGNGTEMGGHAWNIVQIDGVWYNVDLTWEDSGENSERTWFGVPNTEFKQTHIPNTPEDGYAGDWLYDLPTISEERLQPVAVLKNGGEAVFYPNLDKAFEAMQDESASYQVLLCPETDAGRGEGVVVYPYAHTFTTKNIPVAEKITLTGKYVSPTIQTVVTAQNAITVSSPVKIEYGTIQYPYFNSRVSQLTTGTNGTRKHVW